MSAVGVTGSTVRAQRNGAGSRPSAALQVIRVIPISLTVAKKIIEPNHYLHSVPGGTMLCFGVFAGSSLMGALTLGAGPSQAYALVEGAIPGDCMTLTRLWLSDDLPSNSESKVLGFTLKQISKHTTVKFLVSYADPEQGHVGVIYQATNWTYTGLSSAMPLYDIGDGRLQHSRSLSHAYGSHSVKHFKERGVDLKTVPQRPKHRYVYFLDRGYRRRLKTP